MSIQLPIRVSPAVKKYIAHRHEVKPFMVSRSNLFGIFLYNCLAKFKYAPAVTEEDKERVRKQKEVEAKILNPDVYTETLMLGLSDDLYSRRGWYIHAKKQYDFNRLVEMMIEQDFYLYVEIQTQICSAKFDHAFLDFRDIYHFTEDDLALKTMQKRYERYRHGLSA